MLKHFLCLISVLFFVSKAQAERWNGMVAKVSDADTLSVIRKDTKIKVRLHGVDAPESDQPFGQQAKEFVAKMVFGEVVTVDTMSTDRYGREVAKVYIGKKCLNEELIQAGYAWHYKHFSRSKKLAKLEERARQAKKGLWSQSAPCPPWKWRQARRLGPQKAREKDRWVQAKRLLQKAEGALKILRGVIDDQ